MVKEHARLLCFRVTMQRRLARRQLLLRFLDIFESVSTTTTDCLQNSGMLVDQATVYFGSHSTSSTYTTIQSKSISKNYVRFHYYFLLSTNIQSVKI